ncbi:kinase binding protein CGI-121-domain-containing protein [Podospora didyma]|uniref:EKC/KEOPS complex subunit CGI121 n=1 Tax=Podospora didyma TaxID=330526 RepID=A0AAE0U6J3_9PEZI|nr:kinase binding protein CGI-121-domain-containing protein [Podospora didyma]
MEKRHLFERLYIDNATAGYEVHTALFCGVTNRTELRNHLLALNTDYEYAFVNAERILSRAHLLSAIFTAMTSLVQDTLTTKNVHSEIVVSLNPNKNITEAYNRFGIPPPPPARKDNEPPKDVPPMDLIVVKVLKLDTSSSPEKDDNPAANDTWAHLLANVKGEPTRLTDEELERTVNLAKLRGYYGLNNVPLLDEIKEDATLRKQEMERLIIMKMALRAV